MTQHTPNALAWVYRLQPYGYELRAAKRTVEEAKKFMTDENDILVHY